MSNIQQFGSMNSLLHVCRPLMSQPHIIGRKTQTVIISSTLLNGGEAFYA